MSVAFGGPAYVLFAIAMFLWIGRLKDTRSIQRLSWAAPVLFVPVQALSWIVYVYYDTSSAPGATTDGAWNNLVPFAAFVLGIGYGYVVVANLGYAVLSMIGATTEPRAATHT